MSSASHVPLAVPRRVHGAPRSVVSPIPRRAAKAGAPGTAEAPAVSVQGERECRGSRVGGARSGCSWTLAVAVIQYLRSFGAPGAIAGVA